MKINSKWYQEEVIKKIDIPTLIIWGEEDKIIPKNLSFKLKRDIKDSRLLIIPKCGYLPHIEEPKIVAENIFKFIKE